MTREEVRELAIKEIDTHKTVVLELATGFGKTATAIHCMNHIAESSKSIINVLLLVDRDVHKSSWQKEFNIWHLENNIHVVTECYASLKNYNNTVWDIIVMDEAHHLYTDNRMNTFRTLSTKKIIMLSATLQFDFKKILKKENAAFITVDLQEAIDYGVLPTPKIICVPLSFKTDNSEIIVKHAKSTLEPIHCEFKDRFVHMKKPNPIHIHCTPRQYYNDMCDMLEFYKKKHLEQKVMFEGAIRLRYLSEQKEWYVLELLKQFKNRRTLTFCSSIGQTERLGKYNIHSKNKKAAKYLEDFNAKKIKHITACQQLNEGVNLKDCQICIFDSIMASDRINIQRIGKQNLPICV